jgi:hypothetical protein
MWSQLSQTDLATDLLEQHALAVDRKETNAALCHAAMVARRAEERRSLAQCDAQYEQETDHIETLLLNAGGQHEPVEVTDDDSGLWPDDAEHGLKTEEAEEQFLRDMWEFLEGPEDRNCCPYGNG